MLFDVSVGWRCVLFYLVYSQIGQRYLCTAVHQIHGKDDNCSVCLLAIYVLSSESMYSEGVRL